MLGDDLCGICVVGTWDDGGCATVTHPDVVDAVRGLRDGALTLPRTNDTHRPAGGAPGSTGRARPDRS